MTVRAWTLTMAGTTVGDLIDAIYTHINGGNSYYLAIDDYNAGEGILIKPAATPPGGFDWQASLREDGTGKLRISLDPGKGYTGAGTNAAAPTGGSGQKQTEVDWSMSLGTISLYFAETEDAFWFLSTNATKTATPDLVMMGHLLTPVWANDPDNGNEGYGSFIGKTDELFTSNLFYYSGTSGGESYILIDGTWYRTFVPSNSSTILNGGKNVNFYRPSPIPISAYSLGGTTNKPVYVGNTKYIVVMPDDDSSRPRTRVEGTASAYMFVDKDNIDTNFAVAWEKSVTAS